MVHRLHCSTVGFALLTVMVAGTSRAQNPVTQEGISTSGTMVPLTTSSVAAKQHFTMGLRAADVGDVPAARAHLQQAIAADSTFALAHLFAAQNAPSIPSYRAHLERAVQYANAASPAERLMILIEKRGFDGDVNGQLELAQQLVQAAANNPRSYLTLANVQLAMGRTADARATLEKGIQVAPRFALMHIILGNSYLTNQPLDLAMAETHVRHGVDLEANEAYTHDFMGDVYRQKNDLANARAEYTRMTELAPTRAIAFQQRGHVNSFLGNFDEARADYDRAIAVGTVEEKSGYQVYRALVNVHAGDLAAAEREIEQAIVRVDSLQPPNPVGDKITLLQTELQIALHAKHLDVASRAVEQLRPLWQQFAAQSQNEAFKRQMQANIVFDEGRLAAWKGDYEGARAKAREYMTLREPDKNPRKNEAAHELLGFTDLLQGNFAAAAAHLAQGNPNDYYVIYERALALDGAGRGVEAKPLFKRVAETNFNSPGLALVKRDAMKKAAQ